MSKKKYFVGLGIIGIVAVILVSFPRCTLKSIKNKLFSTTKVVVCNYNKFSSGVPCKDKDALKIIINKDRVNEITDIIKSSSKTTGVTTLPGAKYELFLFDKNNKTVASLEYANLVLKKGYSSYSLKSENIKRIGEIIK